MLNVGFKSIVTSTSPRISMARSAVTADRAMEIRGEVLVTMDLKPTFSIDYIRVVMNLS